MARMGKPVRDVKKPRKRAGLRGTVHDCEAELLRAWAQGHFFGHPYVLNCCCVSDTVFGISRYPCTRGVIECRCTSALSKLGEPKENQKKLPWRELKEPKENPKETEPSIIAMGPHEKSQKLQGNGSRRRGPHSATANPKISTVNGAIRKLACPVQLPPAIPRPP
jgi:hypothetical protein